jgi:AraC-like DNA-binding protein
MEVLMLFSTSGISVALFTILLLSSRGSLKLPEKLLIAWLSALCLNQLYFLVIGLGSISLPASVHLAGISMVLVHSPLLYVFSKNVFSEKLSVRTVLHVLPFGLFIAAFGILWLSAPGAMSFREGFIWFARPVFPFQFYGLYLAMVAGVYTLAAYFTVRVHRRKLQQTTSGELRNVLNWLQRWIIAALVFFVLTYLVVDLSVSVQRINTRFTFHIVSLFVTCYIFYVSFWSIRKTDVFRASNLQVINMPEKSEQYDYALNEEADRIAARLTGKLKNDKLYLDPDLSLTHLAQIMELPAGKLSWVINNRMGKNFYDLINEYRVKAFIERLSDPEYAHLSILGLAFECGFRSKSTFNTFFKRHTGETPSVYKKNREKRSG